MEDQTPEEKKHIDDIVSKLNALENPPEKAGCWETIKAFLALVGIALAIGAYVLYQIFSTPHPFGG